MLWFFGLLLLVLVIIGTLASQGKLASRAKQRHDLPGGGTVELSEVIVGKELTYSSGNRIDKYLRKLPREVRNFLPPSWRGYGGGSIGIGPSMGGGLNAGVAFTIRGSSAHSSLHLDVSDGKGWRTRRNTSGMLGVASGETNHVYHLGLLPHSSPELHLSLRTMHPDNEAATFRIANPMYNNPAPDAATPMPLRNESTDGDLTFKLHGAVCGANSNKSDTAFEKLRRSQPEEPQFTYLDVEALKDGVPTSEYSPSSAQLQDSFGAGIWAGIDTHTVEGASRFTVKLQSNVPHDELPFKAVIDFYHNANFTPDESWTITADLPTTGIQSTDRHTTTVGGSSLEVVVAGKEYRDPDRTWARIASDEYSIKLQSLPYLRDYRTELLNAKTVDGREMRKGSTASTYGTTKGMLRLITIRDPDTSSSAVSADPPTSVVITFSVLKARKAEFVFKPMLPPQ